ncbi:hypothetical protein AB0758_00425 [Tolypothrix bouteillei VB521301_2]|jgi:hypothetical protein|uniref:Uncharacterized protein n=1 Tax=Tolypothrix bouteillei VB521301 TaxID=1479485 RepID=A0A0C1RPQ6_9CYAN
MTQLLPGAIASEKRKDAIAQLELAQYIEEQASFRQFGGDIVQVLTTRNPILELRQRKQQLCIIAARRMQ